VIAEARYAAISSALLRDTRVSRSERRGFGSSGLWANGKLFALRSSKGEFVVKLPRDRVDALVASRAGMRFDPGHGRLMKEWLAVSSGTEARLLVLAREALDYASAS
jgi:hypothetical protein